MQDAFVESILSKYFLDPANVRSPEPASSKLLSDLTVSGSLEECKDKISKERDTKKTIILGFDLPKEKYKDDFFDKLDKLLTSLE